MRIKNMLFNDSPKQSSVKPTRLSNHYII